MGEYFAHFPPKIGKFWGKVQNVPMIFSRCVQGGEAERWQLFPPAQPKKTYIAFCVFAIKCVSTKQPHHPCKKCMKKYNVSLINPTLSDLRCFLSDLNLLHKVHFWIFLQVLFFRKSNKMMSERYSDVLWIKNYLWWKNSVLIIREWTLCILGKNMGRLQENFVFFPKFSIFSSNWTNNSPILKKKMGKFWETYKKNHEIFSQFFPVYLGFCFNVPLIAGTHFL